MRKTALRRYREGSNCQCGGRWLVPKRNGTFAVGRGKRGVGKRPIRVYGPVVMRHVPFRGNGAFASASAARMREFQVCSVCGQKNLAAEQRRARAAARPGATTWWGIPIEPLPDPTPDPPKRTRDFSEDAERRKEKARRHKARQARR